MAVPRKELFAQANLVPKPGIGPNGLYDATPPSVEEIEASEKGWLAYFKTRNFYIVLVLGYVSWNEPYIICAVVRTREGTSCACTLIGSFSIPR